MLQKHAFPITETTNQNAASPVWPRRTRIFFSWLLSVLFAMAVIGCMTRGLIYISNRSPGPAGFARGMVHGALMPCALPNLLVGNDVTIYAPVNTGRTYKLGYTVGVNSCGAIFFGFFFWRINRWRKKVKEAMKGG